MLPPVSTRAYLLRGIILPLPSPFKLLYEATAAVIAVMAVGIAPKFSVAHTAPSDKSCNNEMPNLILSESANFETKFVHEFDSLFIDFKFTG